MAPVWMAMSNTLPLASSMPSRLPARIRWPVEEIGRNSVRPSTIPMIAALSNRMTSTAGTGPWPGKGAKGAQCRARPLLSMSPALLPARVAAYTVTSRSLSHVTSRSTRRPHAPAPQGRAPPGVASGRPELFVDRGFSATRSEEVARKSRPAWPRARSTATSRARKSSSRPWCASIW